MYVCIPVCTIVHTVCMYMYEVLLVCGNVHFVSCTCTFTHVLGFITVLQTLCSLTSMLIMGILVR